MMRVLVTGAYGYLGGRIVEALSRSGIDTYGGSRIGREGQKERVTDYEDPDSLAKACEGMDAIVHLAGSNEIEAARDPAKAIYETAGFTQRLAKAAASSGVHRFIYFSTVHVYGSPLEGTLSEVSPARPAHPYSIAHRAAEDYALMEGNRGGMETAVVRLSNAFGYPTRPDVDRWSLLVNDLCKQAAERGSMTLASSGTQLRDFIPLADVCAGVDCLLEAKLDAYPVYNLGSGHSESVYDMACSISSRCASILGHEVPVTRPIAADKQKALEFNLVIRKILNTGYSPRNCAEVELDQMLKLCDQWFGKDGK